MMWIRLAIRNVWKNRRRSIITVLAIMIGLTAVNLFQGYMADSLSGLGRSAIQGESLGHLTVFKRDALTMGLIDEEKYALSGTEILTVRQVVGSMSGVELIAPKLKLSGLVTNGKNSVIFIGIGIDPEDYRVIQRDLIYTGEGRPLDKSNLFGGQMASGLAEALGFKIGDVATLFTTTLKGQMNAVDMDVQGIADTGSRATNDKYIKMPLQLARTLYATDGAHEVAILLDSTERTLEARERVERSLRAAGVDVEVRTWQEMSAFYRSVANLFGTIFGFLFLIVLLVVIMGVFNTMTMSVMERTREIGTLRALGLRRMGVLKLFCVEAAVIGTTGVSLGLVLTLAFAKLVEAAQITYVPPGSSGAVTLVAAVLPSAFLWNGSFLVFLCVVAAFFPARIGYRRKVVDALRHV